MTKKIVFLTICLLPFYVFRGKVFGIPTTLLEVLIGLSTFFWVIGYLKSREPLTGLLKAFQTPLLLPSLLFLVASFLSLFLTPDFFKGLGLYRAYILEPWLLFIICLDVFKEKKELLLRALIISALLVSIPALFQALSQQPIFEDASHEVLQGRVASFYNSANSVALYLGPLISLLFLSFFYPVKWLNSNLAKICLGIFLIVISLTESLGATVALFSVISAYLVYFLVRKTPSLQKHYFKGLLGIVLLLIIGYFVFLVNISFFTPHIGLVYPRPFNSTEVIRLCLWEGSKNLLLAHPLGGGLSSFPILYETYRTCDTELLQYPHNIFLNFWIEVGVLGLLAFSLVIYTFGKKLLVSNLDGWVKVGLLSFLLYLFIHGLFDVPYFKNDLSVQFWVFLAFGLLVIKEKTTDL